MWRRMILDDLGPPDPMTRYVLLVMSSFMDADCSRCFPGIREIAARSMLNKDTVTRHRNEAIRLGFLIPPAAGVHARGRQDWIACLPPETPAVSEGAGHCNDPSVRNGTPHCPGTPDIPAHTSRFSEEANHEF